MASRTILAVLDVGGAPIHDADLHRWIARAPGFPGSRVTTWRADDRPMAMAQRSWCAAVDAGDEEVRFGERWTLVADVRLDERDALAARLGVAPRELASTSDRALIVRAHARWGCDAPAHLRGAFAYVLFDRRSGTLQAVRDPMGEKPLHVHHAAGLVVLSSVLAPILAHPRVDEQLDERGVACLLCAPAGEQSWTLFRTVKQVAPGETWIFEDRNVVRRTYWTWPVAEPLVYRQVEDYAEHFRTLLGIALRDRLRPARRVAVSLSGGLDSTSAAAMVSHLGLPASGETPHAISYVFDELSSCDERRHILPVVERYGLPWHPIVADDLWALKADPLRWTHPHHVEIDPLALLTDAVRREATAYGCDTLLTGAFGDALFDGGRFWLADLLVEGRWSQALAVARRPSARLRRDMLWTYGLRPILPRGALAAARRIRRRPAFEHHPVLPPRLNAALGAAPARLAAYGAPPPAPHWRAARVRDLVLRASSGYRAAQRHALEPLGLRVVDPYLDHRLVSFAMRVPADVLAKPPWTKRLLRLAMADLLPETVRLRPGKTNLLPLVERGLLDREALRAHELATAELAIDHGFVRRDWLEGRAREDPNWFARGWREWRVLALEDWLQRRVARLAL